MKHNYIFILTFALSMWSCSDKEQTLPQPPEDPDKEETVNSITVTRSSFARGAEEAASFSEADATDDGVHDPLNWRYNTVDNMLPGGDEDQFTDQGVLFISQITPTRTPDFPVTPFTWFQDHPNDYYWETDATGKALYTKNDNLWMYKLDKTLGENADWDSGYNFVPMFSEDDPTFGKFRMDWRTIKNYGSLGNAFSFYAMYYPGGNPIFQVNSRQSIWDLKVMKQMDIMGAYHTTPSLYTRMRFRLHHLMVYIRVTLYVPVVEPKYGDKETNRIPENAIGYTGFGRDAFYWEVPQGNTNGRPGIYIVSDYKWPADNNRKIFNQFGIDWRANRSSDSDAPLVQANTSGGVTDEVMHRHATFEHIQKPGFYEKNVNKDRGYYLPDTSLDTDEPEVFEIDRSIFTKVPEGEDPIEKVRRYEFSAIIPPQSLRNGINSNLLLIRLATPGISELPPDLNTSQGTYKMFSFDAKTANLPVNNGQVTLTQGTLLHFYLYIPRSGNSTIVMKANIEPWKSTQTDMTVTEETEGNRQPNEND